MSFQANVSDREINVVTAGQLRIAGSPPASTPLDDENTANLIPKNYLP